MARTCLVLLLLVSSIFSAFGDGVFIDCGGSTVFTDDITSEIWITDADFIQMTGESEVVQTPRGVSTAMTTLRVFTSRSKNCYTLDSFTKGQRVLVRASFYYGNYDKKSAPPTFDLLFDANYWVTVKTSLDQVVYAEVSYVITSTTTSICLAQTQPGQFPIISALELRELDTKMYNLLDSSYALLTKERVAYGASEIIRYPDDDYDRMWSPVKNGTGLSVAQNEAQPLDIDVSSSNDNPPTAVLMNAITTSSTTQSTIKLPSNFPAQATPIYVNMYFSELTATQNRSFQVYMDDKLIDAVVPIYEKVVELIIFNITATTKTSFSLVSDSASTLPPLINAIEVFYVSGPLSDGTNIKDVDGLSALQKGFAGTILDQWSGDPCLPSPYSWEWINCTSEVVPRVTALNLASFGLAGDLSPDFDSMDALEIIDLHNNKITGPIPDFLGTLPNLKVLNLANNDFSGPIPASISMNKKLKLLTSGNKQLCDTGKSCPTYTGTTVGSSSGSGDSSGNGGGGRGGGGGGGGKKKSKTPVIVGTTIPAFLAFWAVVGYFVASRNKRKRAAVSAAGTAGRPNGPNGTPAQERQNNPLMSKVSNGAVNEIKVNIRDEHTNGHQENSNSHENNHHQDDRDTD